jgi:hypothetical protein
MPWIAARKATLLIPSGPIHDPNRKHLHIVVTDPNSLGDVLIVCVVSIPPTNIYDPSCTFFPGEHPFIVKDSFIAFRFSRVVKANLLEGKVATGEYVAKTDLDEKRFADVVVGLTESPFTTPKILGFYRAAICP